MTIELVSVLITLGIVGLGLYLRTYIKSTVAESIHHQFEVELLRMREEFEREIHNVDRKDRFKLVALEKRIEVHQRAYALSKFMILYLSTANGDFHDKIVVDCQVFLNGNSLYLSKMVYNRFYDSFLFFTTYWTERQEAEDLKKNGFEEEYNNARKNFKEEIAKLRSLPSLIAKTVELETLEIDKSKEEESR